STADALPEGGTAVLLGGDILGLDVAHAMAEAGRRVILIASEQAFWPHRVEPDACPSLFEALERAGLEVIADGAIERIDGSAKGGAPRRVARADGRVMGGDGVMPCFGLRPSLEFMVGPGVDIERGRLVNPELKTT